MITPIDVTTQGLALRVTAVVLAAGRSRRMGGDNKLLAELDGKPIIRYVVEAASASRVDAVIVVTGHEAGSLRNVLAGCSVRFIHNPRYAEGLSTSLRVGISAADSGSAGVLVCLGDMPLVTARQLDLMIDAFVERNGRNICVPVRDGRRGNPVLWPRRFYADMLKLTGDEGARSLLARFADLVHQVEMDDEGIFLDIDTPGDLGECRPRSGLTAMAW